MPQDRRYIILFVLLGLISALGGILGNIATNALPETWEPYLWLAWPLFILFTAAGIALGIRQLQYEPGAHTTEAPDRPTPPAPAPPEEAPMTAQPGPAVDETFDYDVFISYSHADKEWVRGQLLPRLEEAGLRVLIDYRDFQPGAPSVTEMERAVLTSRKTLLVLTPDYLESAWAEFEALMLQALDPAARARRLIPLLREECELPLRIGYLTYVNFADPEDPQLAWRRLLTALEAPDTQGPPPPPNEDALAAASQRAAELERVRDLQRKLTDRCSLSDLKDLCFSMGIDYEDYPNVKNDFIRELLADLQKWGQVDPFEETLRREKPWVLR